eukprot:jgi/Ulvmu1/8859/UM049_0041.1
MLLDFIGASVGQNVDIYHQTTRQGQHFILLHRPRPPTPPTPNQPCPRMGESRRMGAAGVQHRVDASVATFTHGAGAGAIPAPDTYTRQRQSSQSASRQPQPLLPCNSAHASRPHNRGSRRTSPPQPHTSGTTRSTNPTSGHHGAQPMPQLEAALARQSLHNRISKTVAGICKPYAAGISKKAVSPPTDPRQAHRKAALLHANGESAVNQTRTEPPAQPLAAAPRDPRALGAAPVALAAASVAPAMSGANATTRSQHRAGAAPDAAQPEAQQRASTVKANSLASASAAATAAITATAAATATPAPTATATPSATAGRTASATPAAATAAIPVSGAAHHAAPTTSAAAPTASAVSRAAPAASVAAPATSTDAPAAGAAAAPTTGTAATIAGSAAQQHRVGASRSHGPKPAASAAPDTVQPTQAAATDQASPAAAHQQPDMSARAAISRPMQHAAPAAEHSAQQQPQPAPTALLVASTAKHPAAPVAVSNATAASPAPTPNPPPQATPAAPAAAPTAVAQGNHGTSDPATDAPSDTHPAAAAASQRLEALQPPRAVLSAVEPQLPAALQPQGSATGEVPAVASIPAKPAVRSPARPSPARPTFDSMLRNVQAACSVHGSMRGTRRAPGSTSAHRAPAAASRSPEAAPADATAVRLSPPDPAGVELAPRDAPALTEKPRANESREREEQKKPPAAAAASLADTATATLVAQVVPLSHASARDIHAQDTAPGASVPAGAAAGWPDEPDLPCMRDAAPGGMHAHHATSAVPCVPPTLGGPPPADAAALTAAGAYAVASGAQEQTAPPAAASPGQGAGAVPGPGTAAAAAAEVAEQAPIKPEPFLMEPSAAPPELLPQGSWLSGSRRLQGVVLDEDGVKQVQEGERALAVARAEREELLRQVSELQRENAELRAEREASGHKRGRNTAASGEEPEGKRAAVGWGGDGGDMAGRVRALEVKVDQLVAEVAGERDARKSLDSLAQTARRAVNMVGVVVKRRMQFDRTDVALVRDAVAVTPAGSTQHGTPKERA